MSKLTEWIADKIGVLNTRLYNTNEDFIMFGVDRKLKKDKKREMKEKAKLRSKNGKTNTD